VETKRNEGGCKKEGVIREGRDEREKKGGSVGPDGHADQDQKKRME